MAAAEALAAAAHQQSLAEAVAAHAVQLADVQAELHRARSREQRYIRDSQEVEQGCLVVECSIVFRLRHCFYLSASCT